jgi:hypothetical protein
MTAHIQEVSRAEFARLISSEVIGTMSDRDCKVIGDALVYSTKVWLGMVDGRILGFWGVILPSLLSDRAYFWLHTTPALEEHQFVFIRHSQMAIKEMLREYPLISGHTIKGSEKSIRWLKWLGAEFLPADPSTEPLIPFEIRAA